MPCALHTREYHGASAGPAAQDATARAPRLSCSPAEGQRPHRVWKDLQPIVMAFSDGSRGAFCAQGSTWRAREHRRKVSGIFFSTTEPIQAFDQAKKMRTSPRFPPRSSHLRRQSSIRRAGASLGLPVVGMPSPVTKFPHSITDSSFLGIFFFLQALYQDQTVVLN